MNENKDYFLKVKDFFQEAKSLLKLSAPLGKTGFSRPLKFEGSKKSSFCIQVWGKGDRGKFIQPSPVRRIDQLENIQADDFACLILAGGIQIPPETADWARKVKMAVFLSPLSKTKCQRDAGRLLDKLLSKKAVIPGGLLKIYDLGVLIIGDSGIGKSESALELISRGHLFISDDVTLVKRTGDEKLIGKAPSLSQNFMEIRGLSIINIKEIFGPQAVCRQSQIHLVVNLKRWEQGKKYDRLGLETPEEYDILGVKVPKINIPVAPGRNIAALIEVACKVHILGKRGYHAPEEIAKKLDRALSLK